MPTDDHAFDDSRLEQALHDAAPTVPTSGVVTQVTRRRTQRRRNRRLAAGALAVVVVLVVGTATALVTRDDSSSPHIASPGARLQARVITGDGAVDGGQGNTATPTRVVLDQDAQLLRAPVLVGAAALSVASYDPGPDGIATSHVVRIDGATVLDIVQFKATRVLSMADGEGARWALTENYETTGKGRVPDSFLKRIPASGVPQSTPLPQNAEPVGPIAALGGAVWVPVRDGVLEFDPAGNLLRHIPLPDATHRWVAQVGKRAAVTDGRTVRSLDVSGAMSDPVTYGPEILGLASAGFDGRVLLAPENGGLEHARVAHSTSDSPVEITATLPDGFVADGLAASTTRLWVTGTVDDAPAIALLGDDGVRATIVLENATSGTALAWTDARTVRIVSNGVLSEITVP